MNALLLALQLLTRLPVRRELDARPEALGRSVLCYPLVGLVVGVVAAAAGWLAGATPLLAAALALAAWIAVTGALHLDGLADSADAWIGGHGDRARTLEIMKDPACGPVAVVVLVALLLVKFAALAALLEADQWGAPVAAAVAGRAVLVALFLSTPYARPGGMGEVLARHLPRRAGRVVVAASALFLMLGWDWAGVAALAAVALLLVVARRALLARLGGTTGDSAGALVELAEGAVLVALAASL